MIKKCLFCKKLVELDDDQYQFCDDCCGKLERLEVDLEKATKELAGD